MAKAKAPVGEDIVTIEMNTDFAEPVPAEVAPRGGNLQADIDAIRKQRAAARAVHGKAGKKRKITNYHDAERLRNLGLLTAEEHVDCEEEGLFPDPAHYATGTTAETALGVPPDEGV